MTKRWLSGMFCALAAFWAGEARAATIVALSPDTQSLIFIDVKKVKVTKTVRLKGDATVAALRTISFNPGDGQVYGMDASYDLYRITPSTGASKYTGNIGRFSEATTRMDCAAFTLDTCRFATQSGFYAVFNLPKGKNSQILPALNGLTGKRVLGVAYYAASNFLLVEGLTDQLYRVSPPNEGKMVVIGKLGIDVEAPIAFDILTTGKKAGGYMISKRMLHKVNPGTGKASKGVAIKKLTTDVTDMVVLDD